MEDKLILLELSKEPLAELYNIENYKIERSISGVDEISFTIYQKFTNVDFKEEINPIYDLIQGNMYIELNESEIFVITKPVENVDENGIAFKEIVAYSKEFELRNKLIIDFEGEDRVLYEPSNQKDDNGVYFGLLNYLEDRTNWKVNYYNTDILKRKKTLSYNKDSFLSALSQAQQDFQCLIKFNTMDETIDILSVEQVGSDKGLYLSNENFINTLTKEINAEDIVTRLYLYGRDDLDVSRVNITGQKYIENYDFFMNTKYMSQELINALSANKTQIGEHSELWNVTFKELLAKEKERTNFVNGVQLQEGLIEKMYRDYDDNIENEEERLKIKKEIENREKALEGTKNKIVKIDIEIAEINLKLDKISEKLNIKNNLSDELLNELDKFVKEDVYNTDYGQYGLVNLYEDGVKMLEQISKPFLEFSIEVDDFTKLVEAEDIKTLLKLGDIVHLEHIIINDYYDVRLIGYVKSEDGLELRFSSKQNIYNEEIFLEDILADAKKTSDTVDFSRFNWDKAVVVDNEFKKYISSELNLANQNLVKAEGQRPIFDDRGLWLYKENKDGSISPEQVRAVNNIIAITKDNWETVDVAITPNGVMANQLIGDVILGTDLKIISNSGVVEILENLLTIRDDEGRTRVQLGNYSNGKYGLKIMDKSGNQTILDEDGMLQIWQEGRTDNVDANNKLELYLYIPKSTLSIRKSILRFKRLPFRTYSKATSFKGSSDKVSDDGGYKHIYNSTDDGGYKYVSDTTEYEKRRVETTHSMDNVDGKNIYPDCSVKDINGNVLYGQVHGGIYYVNHHEHEIDIPGHDHEFEINIPDHQHEFEVTIPNHHHEVNISHEHDIVYGIYKSTSPYRVKVYVNGLDRTSDLGGSYSGFTSDEDNLDITRWLSRGKWNKVELTSDKLGRIDASVFVEAFIGFNEE